MVSNGLFPTISQITRQFHLPLEWERDLDRERLGDGDLFGDLEYDFLGEGDRRALLDLDLDRL